MSHGNTPTDVGKTCAPQRTADNEQKHPHGRGEDISVRGGCVAPIETPPRTWGRLSLSRLAVASFGNTPTDVGKTCS